MSGTSSDQDHILEAIGRFQRPLVSYAKFLHELSYQEISEVTDLSISNVGYLIHVGLRTIREKLSVAPRAAVEK